jgi:hypothetical protein
MHAYFDRYKFAIELYVAKADKTGVNNGYT